MWPTPIIRLPLRKGIQLFCIASCIWGPIVDRVEAASNGRKGSSLAAQDSKDPKLSWPLLVLCRAVPQQQAKQAPMDQTASGLSAFIENSSKPITDMLRARRMRINQNAEVQVYIEASSLRDENLHALRALGVKVQVLGEPVPNRSRGEVLATVPTAQALLPITMIEQAKELPFVRYIRLPDYAVGNTGSVDSQGDSILQADTVRSQFDVDGTGVRVGVISDGIGGIFATGCTTCGPTSNNPSPISLGDLPNASGTRNSNGILVAASGGIIATSFNSDGNLEECLSPCDTTSGEGAEGTAMLEIVHDLAPGAQLYFANGDSAMNFEQAVDFLGANTDIAVTDISYFTPPFDGTSSVSMSTVDALNNATNPIRGFFVSSGNFAQDHYQGLYADSGMDGTSITGEAGDLHLFQGAPPNPEPPPSATTDNENFGPTVFDPIIVVPSGEEIEVYLAWNDATGESANDYDLFLVPLNCSGVKANLPVPPCTIAGPPVMSSKNPQTGSQDPTESLAWPNMTGSAVSLGIVIQNVKNLAAARTFNLFVHGYGDKQSSPNHNFNTVSGSVPAVGDSGGLPMMASVITVGAIDESLCPSPDNCTGPVELFSSQGPTQTTPQAVARIKPDLVAVDKVCITGAGGFGNGPASDCAPSQPTTYTPQVFGGTSAAVPHVAAIAALGLESAPCLLSGATNPAVASTARVSLETNLLANAVPLPGVSISLPNNIEGNGLVDALSFVMALLPKATAGSSQTVSATSANGATVELSGAGTDPNNCLLTAMKWTGSCGTGSATGLGLHANLMCPIGVDTVQVSVSNNGVSFSQPGTVPYTVVVTDFMLSASPGTASVTPGNPTIYSIAVTSAPQGAFSNPVSLTCSSGLPPGAVCSFSPTSVTPGTSVISTLTIFTSGATLIGPNIPSSRPYLKLPVLWSFSVMFLIFVAIWTRSFGRRLSLRFSLCALLISLTVSTAGCGSKSTTPASNIYTVTITGTSNQLQHQTTVSLTVQ
jgi:hypothetical protein